VECVADGIAAVSCSDSLIRPLVSHGGN